MKFEIKPVTTSFCIFNINQEDQAIVDENIPLNIKILTQYKQFFNNINPTNQVFFEDFCELLSCEFVIRSNFSSNV